MKTTRQRLLEYLGVKQVATAQEISRALHVTSADVRHHLNSLVEEGVVQIVAQRPAQSRGRPSNIYGLAGQFGEHNLDRLASELFGHLLSGKAGDERLAVLRELAGRLAGGKTAQARSDGQKLRMAVARLNEMHYLARWEARASGPRVILGHCPYAGILEDHPELCMMDEALLEELLGDPARQVARREPTPQGTLQCVFVMSKKK